MTKLFCFVFLLFTVSFSSQNISYKLYNELESKNADETIDVILKFENDLDFDRIKDSFNEQQIKPKERARIIIEESIDNLSKSIQSLIEYSNQQFIDLPSYSSIWIANAITLEIEKFHLQKILESGLIEFADLNEILLIIPDLPVRNESISRTPGGHEPGHDIIGAPELWEMGYTGVGTTLLSFDTGFWPAHPAIGNRYKGNFLSQNQCWFPYDLASPGDKSNSHGTHTIGTVLGLDTLTNDTIGVAPGAYFIATDPIVTDVSDIKTWEELAMGFQWALNPDGDLNTSDDVPDVINNSWGRPVEGDVEPCEEIMSTIFDAIEAAGIANVFSAGNSGPDPMSISAPHNINQGLVNSFTVGAVNLNPGSTIAGFSSRGPSLCGGDSSILIKPEVVAPGVNIRSAVNQDEYDNYQGTSMAAPHVSGAVLLLKEAFPQLPGEEILLALYYSANDLGDPGEDNVYGNGLINVLDAYNYLLGQGYTSSPPISNNYELAIKEILDPFESFQCSSEITPQLVIKNLSDSTITGFEVFYEIVGSGDQFSQSLDVVILPDEEQVITLSTFNTSVLGPYELMVLVQLPLDQEENDYLNNQRIFRGNIRPSYEPDPIYLEDFENGISEIDWYIFNDDMALTWDTAFTNGLDNGQISAILNFYDYSPKLNQKDELISPVFSISEIQSSLKLEFDYAYQRRGNSFTLKDTLRIFVSPDCGETWDLHWEAYADSLSTMNDNSTLAFYPDSSEHWSSKTLNLDEYISTAEEIIFKFQTTNRNGNNLFIDNVQLYYGDQTVSIPELIEFEFEVSPNPSEGTFLICNQHINKVIFAWQLINSQGKLIKSGIKSSNECIFLNLKSKPNGVYFFQIIEDVNGSTLKLIKK